MAAPLVEDLVLGRGSRVPDMPTAGSSADMAIDVDDFESPSPPPRPAQQRRGRRRALLTPPLSNIPREPIVLDDSDGDGEFDPEAAHDEIMFGAGPGPSSRPRRRPHRRALFSPPPPPPQAAGPPPPVPGIPDRLRHLRLSIRDLFMNPFEGGNQQQPHGFGAFWPAALRQGPPPNPFPDPPPALGLGGYILRQAQQNVGRGGANGRNIRFTFDFGMPGLGVGLDADGWQRYDEEVFERLQQPAEPPPTQYKREFLFKTPVPAGFTSDFAPPDPPEAPKVFDVETGEEVIDKGKRKAEPAQRLLVCAKCVDPLRADQNARAGRVWALRCGHVIDGKCLAALAEDAELLHEHTHAHADDHEQQPSPARRPARRAKPKAKRGRKPPPEPEPEVLVEREWACPVPRCGKAHYSQLVRKVEPGAAPAWVQKAGCGAIQVFV